MFAIRSIIKTESMYGGFIDVFFGGGEWITLGILCNFCGFQGGISGSDRQNLSL